MLPRPQGFSYGSKIAALFAKFVFWVTAMERAHYNFDE